MNVRLESLTAHFDRVIELRDAALVQGWYKPAKLEELNAEVARIEPSTSYSAHLDRAIDDFAAELLDSPEFHDMHARWATLDTETEQRAYLQKCVSRLAWHQAQIGVATTIGNVKFYNYEDPVYASDAYIAFDNDVTQRLHDDICFNLARPSWTKDLVQALKIVAHEQTHLFNLSLNSQYHQGWIKPGHVLHDEAVYFNQHFTRSARIDFTFGRYAHPQRNPYLNQLDERVAYRADDRLPRLLEAGLAEHEHEGHQPLYQSQGGQSQSMQGMRVS